MTRLRYVKGPDELKDGRAGDPEFLSSRVRSIRVVYETDPAVAAAVLPRPLEAGPPEVRLTLSQVSIEVSPELTIDIGSAVFGVAARHGQDEGTYLITMPMTTEAAVIGGRETYGEPKKIADIAFEAEGERVRASVTRMGATYLEVSGTLGEDLGPRAFEEHAFCFKAFPSCDPDREFDDDPLLVRLDWQHDHERAVRVDGDVTLRESPFDPVADLPVRRVLRMEYEEGRTRSRGTVLRRVPGAWLLPWLHQRYDEPGVRGIEVDA